MTPRGYLKQPSRQEAINWVSVAWEIVSEEFLASSFLTSGISYSLDDTEDVLIRHIIPRELDVEEDDSDVATRTLTALSHELCSS